MGRERPLSRGPRGSCGARGRARLIRPPPTRHSRRTGALHSPRGPVSLPPASLSAMVAQPRPKRGASGAAPALVQVSARVLSGARAGSEPLGCWSTALTRPPPQPGLLPVLLPGPPPSPSPAPRTTDPAGWKRPGKRDEGRRVVGPARTSPSEVRLLLSGAHRLAVAVLVARPGLRGSPDGCGHAQSLWLGERWGSISGPLGPAVRPLFGITGD